MIRRIIIASLKGNSVGESSINILFSGTKLRIEIIGSKQDSVSLEAVQFLLLIRENSDLFLCVNKVKVLTGKNTSNKFRWHLRILECHALEMEE